MGAQSVHLVQWAGPWIAGIFPESTPEITLGDLMSFLGV
jgi:hypothetical protein